MRKMPKAMPPRATKLPNSPKSWIGTEEKPGKVQKAFIDNQAAQCGYCTNGMIMSAKALLDRSKNPSEDQIRQALSSNLVMRKPR